MSPRLRAYVAALLFLVLAAIAAARVQDDLVDPLRPRLPHYGLQDFRDNFYYPSVAWLQGRNPYDVDDYRAHYPVDRPLPAYSPISLLVHLPLALLPFRAAMAADFVLNTLLLLALAAVAVRGAGPPVTGDRVLALAALMALSRPGQQNLYIGQCAAYVGLGAAVALIEARRRPWLAGLGLALACLKPTYGLPLGLLMLFRRDLAAFARGAGLAALAGAIGAAVPVSAAGGVGPFIASVRHGMRVVATDPAFHEPASLIRIDTGALVGRFLGRPPGAVVEILILAAILVTAGVLLRTCEARGTGGTARAPGDGLACLAILLAIYHQSYDALLLALPIAALLFDLCEPGWSRAGSPARWTLVALLLVPWLNLVATHAVLNRVESIRVLWLPLATANGAAILAAAITWGWWMARRAPPVP